jgi:hypothetical protein
MAPPPRSPAAAATALLALALVLTTLPSPASAQSFGDAATANSWSPTSTSVASPNGRSVCYGCSDYFATRYGEASFLVSKRFPGRVYVTDRFYSLCKTHASAGQPSWTLAGPVLAPNVYSNPSGYAGDGGLANASTVRLNLPLGFAEDSQGNVFINDFGNRKIRRVDAVTGIITTYADTSFMRFPNSMTMDTSTDTLYVGDVGARLRNSGQTTADYTLTIGSEVGGIYSFNATTGSFTLFAGGPDVAGVARPSAWESGYGQNNTRMVPFKIRYVAARNSIAWLDPLNSLVTELTISGPNAGLKTHIAGNGAGSATSTNPYDAPAVGLSTYASAGSPPTNFSTVGTALAFGWGNNIGPTGGYTAGFGISDDGANIVICARNFIVGGTISFLPGQANQGTLTHSAVAWIQSNNPMNENWLEDCEPDYDGLGVFYLSQTAGAMTLRWRRTASPAGTFSVDGTGFGISSICPVGSFAAGSSNTTCLHGPSKGQNLVRMEGRGVEMASGGWWGWGVLVFSAWAFSLHSPPLHFPRFT